MALKGLTEVKHVIITGAVRELNFYVQDILRGNPGFKIEKVVVLNAPADKIYSEAAPLTLLYVFVKDGSKLGDLVETVAPAKNGKEPKELKENA